MDIGKRKEDYTFYKGYEGETELAISTPNETIHIWDGYMNDIFGNPIFPVEGWSGFTKDYNEFTGPYDDECIECAIETDKYLEDVLQYRNSDFSYIETKDVLKKLIAVLQEAKNNNTCLLAKVK